MKIDTDQPISLRPKTCCGKGTTTTLLAAAFAFAAFAALAPAQTAAESTTSAKPTVLDDVVISASRTPQDVKTTPSSVSVISLPEMERQQITDLRTALQTVPGVVVPQNGGGLGSQSMVSIRGADTDHTLFMVDGIRVNTQDFTAGYSSLLGGVGLGGLDRVEVLRGAQSVLYGSAAIGGVISLQTPRGQGPASGVLSAGGGSFNTFGGSASISGSGDIATGRNGEGPFSYSLNLALVNTENDRDYNDFKQVSFAGRAEYALSDLFTFGVTYRAMTSDYEEPGSILSPWPGYAELENTLATAYADWHPSDVFTSRLTYGWVQNLYSWSDSTGEYPSHSTRNIIDWQNTWQATEWLQLVAGVNAEWSRYTSSGTRMDDDLRSLYANVLMQPVRNLEYTVGFRADDYDTFDTHATWRTGAAYRIEKTNTTLRANYGTGFNAPAPQYVLGGGFYVASPNLNPEESKGWDAGIEQDIWDGRVTLGATYFRNEFTNKFSTQMVGSQYQYYNLPGESTTDGAELSLATRPHESVRARVSYTYLSARDDNGGRLPYSVRHVLSGDVNWQATRVWLIGAGASFLAGRVDNYSSAMDDYVTVRLYTSYELRPGLTLKARIENLFDEGYDSITGYPALPFGAYGSIEWRF
ncbi:TonB-dependent receptor plug domain-containing protein [Geminisphaera colitermitum]|uniref:TonB-dependent receptor plug domain-containing protein n=1 Tax=Geminisphaera colitermitum TaxID=1148786 RepID=UPI000196551E|nr:TonB-dependent receptor [Geminisphaera colitermitum]